MRAVDRHLQSHPRAAAAVVFEMRQNFPRALNYFTWFTLAATLALICVGGVVTSKGVGMAVPDWPNSYGYNMFFFPVSKWIGGIFYEHLHRLSASAVGLLTLVLAGWLWRTEKRRWVRWLGVVAVFAVVLQGVLGGLRVVLDQKHIGIFHALLAQLFFLLIGTIALVTTPWWHTRHGSDLLVYDWKRLRYFYIFVTGLVLLQLFLGATMRHQHAGLAIPDFPLAYGRVWPPMDEPFLKMVNQHRVGIYDHEPVTAFHIALQMAHRIMAIVILLGTVAAAWLTRSKLGAAHLLSRMSLAWVSLVLAQGFLGAATIWTNKSADVATAHVALGAMVLFMGMLLILIACSQSSTRERSASQSGDLDGRTVLSSTVELPLKPRASV